jgi:hypothetical protein
MGCYPQFENHCCSLCAHTYEEDDVGPQDPHAAAQYSPQGCACLAYTRGVRLHGNQVNHVERDGEAELYEHNSASREPNEVGPCKGHITERVENCG